ncbi:MAG: NAD-dependent deacylase [Candidatus Aminicenantes bacterium]|nr:NAD-dependent deacylase [Candidatus Aminicenantes bacterium]
MNDDLLLDPLIDILVNAKNIAVLTGAGISAESGIPTFRGEEGLWKQYRAEDLATPGAFENDPSLVWEWYDWRRGIIGSKDPNPGHSVLASWEKDFPLFHIITQNIDGLHQKAGSKNVLELHGNIWKLRCTEKGTLFDDQHVPLEEIPPLCPDCGALLRPHVVWFGESLDMGILNAAFRLSGECDVMFVVGTSAVVQPAASLPLTAREAGAVIVEINPDDTPLTAYVDFSFQGRSGEILSLIDKKLIQVQKPGKD